jgi:hypothetical protein
VPLERETVHRGGHVADIDILSHGGRQFKEVLGPLQFDQPFVLIKQTDRQRAGAVL